MNTPKRKAKTRIKICKEEGCFNEATSSGFCRLHYLRNWRKIQLKRQKAAATRLNKYVERMSRQFPDRYVEEIKKDLRTRSFERLADDQSEGSDDISILFSDGSYDDDVEQLIHELKIERDF